MKIHRRLLAMSVASAALVAALPAAAGAAPGPALAQAGPPVALQGGLFARGPFGPLTDDSSQTFNYDGGTVQTVDVPAGADLLDLTGIGGDGGRDATGNGSATSGPGAVVNALLQVTPGQRLLISVGGMGQAGGTTTSDPRGGWGGLGMVGGAGNGAKDHWRTSGGGGGATTVQIENADGSDLHTILVAAGGGGAAGPSGDSDDVGLGGDAGAGWSGQNGANGSTYLGGTGGAAAQNADGAGSRGQGGSGAGGNGGGGGGGVLGGAGGGGASGLSAGGGGGSGSSATYRMTGWSISHRYSSNWTPNGAQNGVVTVVWK
jgi:hypothetical protein